MISWQERLLTMLFPRKCPICSALCEPGRGARLCGACEERLQRELSQRCPVCGERAPECRCLPALVREAGLDHVSAGFYDPGKRDSATSQLVFALKRSQDDAPARIFSMLLAPAVMRVLAVRGENVRDWTFVYPPRSAEALSRYGFDQAKRLAVFCAHATGAEYASLLVRHGGAVQKKLSASERQENASASFCLRRRAGCQGKKYIVIDDIMTSGATAVRCAELLLRCGASDVIAATPLKTLPRKSGKRMTEANEPWFADAQ